MRSKLSILVITVVALFIFVWFFLFTNKHDELVPALSSEAEVIMESIQEPASVILGQLEESLEVEPVVEEAITDLATADVAKQANELLPEPVLGPKARIINALSQETTLESIENLANYDDVLPVTSMFSSSQAIPQDSYEYSRLLTTRLNRMRKIYTEAQDNPEQVIAMLMQKLSSSAENYDKCVDDWRREVAFSKTGVITSAPNDYQKRIVHAPTAVYLLAELHAYESLPLMHEVFTADGLSPVNRVFLFYSMHLLAKDYPTDNLSPEACQTLDAYLTATRNIPEAEVIDVPTWNAAYDNSDFRQVILGRDMTENQPKIQMRLYPKSLKQYEIIDWDATYVNRMRFKPEIGTYVNLLKDFIDKAY